MLKVVVAKELHDLPSGNVDVCDRTTGVDHTVYCGITHDGLTSGAFESAIVADGEVTRF
jgi:hypothetical protein